MANIINSGSVESLQKGQCILLSAQKCKGNKVQLQFAEKKGNGSSSLLAKFNKGDDRFSSKATRAWLTVEPLAIKEFLGIDVSYATGAWEVATVGGKDKEIIPLNILNPLSLDNNSPIRVQVIETTQGTEFELKNVDTTAKRAGRDGEFILHKGKHIFMHKEIVDCEPIDVLLTPDNNATEVQANESVVETQVKTEEEVAF